MLVRYMMTPLAVPRLSTTRLLSATSRLAYHAGPGEGPRTSGREGEGSPQARPRRRAPEGDDRHRGPVAYQPRSRYPPAGSSQSSFQYRDQSSSSPFRRADSYSSSPRTNKNLVLKPSAHGRFQRKGPPPKLLTLADLSPLQISRAITDALLLKYLATHYHPGQVASLLKRQTIALVFSKRSTRTRVASESAAHLLGGNVMFLGKEDSQLGVNETLRDTAYVVGSMTEGFMARVNAHEEVAELARHSPVPVINALCDLYHPTQILADLMALYETYRPQIDVPRDRTTFRGIRHWFRENIKPLECLKGKRIAYVGDTNNISNELLVTVPRLGMEFAIASPEGYNKVDPRVWERVVQAGVEDKVTLTTDPQVAIKDADVVVTDTWVSMGQEQETAARLQAFAGYQVTNEMVTEAGAKPDWKFMHCLPRHKEEVDDEVFYGPRSIVFPEAENRKWTTAACFSEIFGLWRLWDYPERSVGGEDAEADAATEGEVEA